MSSPEQRRILESARAARTLSKELLNSVVDWFGDEDFEEMIDDTIISHFARVAKEGELRWGVDIVEPEILKQMRDTIIGKLKEALVWPQDL